MAIENPPTYESNEKKAEEMAYEDEAKRNDIKRAENMAYAEDKDRSTVIDLKKKQDDSTENIEKLKSKVNNLKEEGKKYQTDIIKKEKAATRAGEKAGKEYDKNKAAEGMAYTKEVLKKTLPEKNSLSDIEKQFLEAASNKVGEKAGKKHDIENMAYEDEAKRNDVKRAESMAYVEETFRKTLPVKDWTPEQNKDLKDITEKTGEEYDTERRQSLQGIDDRFLSQYREMALHEMEADMAERILKADSADQMAEIANSMIATQESVAEDEKYVKKMSPLEWVNYRVDKIRNEKKFSFARDGVSDDILNEAKQENLDRVIKTLSNKESQILHLKGLIRSKIDNSRNADFASVSENAPRLKELESEEIKLEKEVETAKLWLKDVISKKEGVSTASVKGTETKNGSSDSVEAKPGKAAKWELPGWLKIFGQMVGGLFLIGWAALFGFLEKQVPGGRKGKKE